MQIVSIGVNLQEMSNPVFWENKKHMLDLSSAEYAERDVNVKEFITNTADDTLKYLILFFREIKGLTIHATHLLGR